jgi:hypothetical protein
MRQTIKFYGTKAECEAQALQRCRDYLGDRFDFALGAIRDMLCTVGATRRQRLNRCKMALSFAGVEGYYPVRAMIRAALKG